MSPETVVTRVIILAITVLVLVTMAFEINRLGKYEGPVPVGADEKHYRNTGETRYE